MDSHLTKLASSSNITMQNSYKDWILRRKVYKSAWHMVGTQFAYLNSTVLFTFILDNNH